jgi:hypothetical protein
MFYQANRISCHTFVLKLYNKKKHHDLSYMCEYTPQQAINKEHSCAIQSVFLVERAIRAVKLLHFTIHIL